MKKILRFLGIVIFLFTVYSLLFTSSVYAENYPYLVTEGFDVEPGQQGRVITYLQVSLSGYEDGNFVISKYPDGTGDPIVGDSLMINNYPTGKWYEFKATTNCLTFTPFKIADITDLYSPFSPSLTVRFIHACNGRAQHIGPFYIVNTNATKRKIKPIIDLPWDYAAKGQTFTEAALSMTSYFDHSYPLLSSGLSEPTEYLNQITSFSGENSTRKSYSSHDGYDYARVSKVVLGDPVLAAASGTAEYKNDCASCGNMILIDHHNGYQTRYLHLQKDGLITNIPDQKVEVVDRQQIGLIGATGNVIPSGDRGAHIHFMVVQDKDNDGNFEDNIIDGLTDPFGWQSVSADPWETYSFNYQNEQKTGNKSLYLWKNQLDGLKTQLPSTGGIFASGNTTVTFPENSFGADFAQLSLQPGGLVQTETSLISLGLSAIIELTDGLDKLITELQQAFTLTFSFDDFDLSSVDASTISLYSSQDGNVWTKEETVVDLENKKATATVNHLTQFAVMAEKIDTEPPVTTAQLSGDQGDLGWYRSDVSVEFVAVDNEGGAGVDYTLYTLDGYDWETYTEPFTVTSAGHHIVTFYSVDKGDNIEDVKTVEFDIDKTAPEVELAFDTSLFDLEPTGLDPTSEVETTVFQGKHNVKITDKAGNTLLLHGTKITPENKVLATIKGLKYNDDSLISIPDNTVTVKYVRSQSGALDLLDQRYKTADRLEVIVVYTKSTNSSLIQVYQDGQIIEESTLEGMRLLKLFTENGTLKYAYL